VDGGTILDYTHRVSNRRRDLLRSVSALLFAGLLTGCGPSIQQRACTADCQRTNDNCLLAATTSSAVASCDRLIDSCRAKCPG
jgi:hypothetical protein